MQLHVFFIRNHIKWGGKMYLAYVDESGDSGMNNSPTPYFILSALVVHETKWNRLLKDILEFRREMRDRYGLLMREEIHAAEFIRGNERLKRIDKHIRLLICKRVIEFQEQLDYISIINVILRKEGKPKNYNVFEIAWSTLIQRIHNTIFYQNFPGGFHENEGVLLIPDKTDDKKLRSILRRMRVYNYVPYKGGVTARQIQIDTVIEDPFTKDSATSYFHQLADVNAYFLQQHLKPNSYIRKKKGHNYFNIYDKALCKKASSSHERGFVFI